MTKESARSDRRIDAGVTIVELLVLITLLSVLTILATHQFRFLRARAQESTLRGELGSIRGALLIYYGDSGGNYPLRLAALAAGGKYIAGIPRVDIPAVESTKNPGHKGFSEDEQIYAALPSSAAEFKNEGAALWGYMNEPRRSGYGHVFVNCQHRDSKSAPWTRW